MKANRHPSATQPIASDKPLIAREESQRAASTLIEYKLAEEDRQALIARYGAPKMPLKNNRNGYYVQRGS